MTKRIDRESESQQPGLKGFFYWWLENPNNKKIIFVDILLNLVIIASIYSLYVEYSYNDSIPPQLVTVNNLFLAFFIIEYIIRFYISTDFLADASKEHDGSNYKAITNKIRWMVKFFSLIDLLAILPAIRYLRILRTIRILRFIRLLRFLRVLKIFRHFQKYLLIFRGLTENWRVFTAFIIGTLCLVGIFSFGIYYFEFHEHSKNFDTYSEAFWHSLQVIGLAEDSPRTIGGKFFSSFVTVSNIFFISIIISLMTVKMGEIMDKVKTGNLGKISLRKHIILCGYTRATRLVIDELLKDKKNFGNIVLVTLREDPDINGVLYYNGDFSEVETLKNINLRQAESCVVFSESRNGEDKKTTDLRTVLTVYNIKSDDHFKKVHTISEINHSENANIIKEKMKGDELIRKEVIDASVISTCVRFPKISPIIYELLDSYGKKLEEKPLKTFELEPGAKLRDARIASIDLNMTVLGVLRNGDQPELTPDNDFVLKEKDRIIAIA
jgi:voltage-gated potassium channel